MSETNIQTNSESASPTDTTYLYRVENPDMPQRSAQNNMSHPDIVGQWFTPDPAWATNFLRKANARPGAQLVVTEVPTSSLDALHAANHPIASQMDYQGDSGENYIVPRDGTFPSTTIDLGPVLGELTGSRLGDLAKFTEAQRRVLEHLGQSGLMTQVEVQPVTPVA